MVAIMNLTLLVLEQKTINNVAICGHIIDCCFSLLSRKSGQVGL